MSKVKCPLRELKEKQGGFLNKFDNFVDDMFEKVEAGYVIIGYGTLQSTKFKINNNV